MSHPDDVARLREIKRLLERIQRLPRLASMPVNAPLSVTVDDPMDGLATIHRAGPANGFHNGLAGRQSNGRAGAAPGVALGPPHPMAEAGLALEMEREPAAGMALLEPPLDPLPSPFEQAREEADRGDYWATDSASDTSSRALVPTRPSAGSGPALSPWVFIIATAVNTVVAAVLAVVITLGVARRDAPPAETDKIASVFKPASEGQPEPGVPRPLELLPIGSSRSPLRLEALKPARLPFEVRPEEALQESFILVLTGLPANATLSGAIRMSVDTWHLPPGALQHLEIVVPEWSEKVYEIGVELRRTNGAVAAQSRLWLAVPPPPTPTGASLDEAAVRDLVKSGDKLLSRGDVASARAMYERAAAMGSAQAALAMGTTYDPRRLWALGVFGMVGNKDRARQWYQRADELGHPEAKSRIAALQ